MSIASEITRISNAVGDITQAVSDMGGDVSSVSGIDDLATAVSSIDTSISVSLNGSTYTAVDKVVTLPSLMPAPSLVTYTDNAVTISSLADNTVYNCTASVTSLTISATAQTTLGGEAIIYLTTGTSASLSRSTSIQVVGSDELAASTQYVIAIKNNIMVIGEVV